MRSPAKRFAPLLAVAAALAISLPSVTVAQTGPTTSLVTDRPERPPSPIGSVEPAACGAGSWVAGTVEVCGGEIVYRDYVFDDFGASLIPAPPPDYPDDFGFHPGFVSGFDGYGYYPPVGAQRLGASDNEDNTSDLVALRLRRSEEGSRIHVTAELNTVRSPNLARVVLAVDRDANNRTGGGPWPGLIANPLLAIAPTSPGWDGGLVTLEPPDPDTNVATASFPAPPGRFRIWAVVTNADGVVMNVAFRGTTETGFWWDAAQAVALYSGNLGPFVLDVAAEDLLPGTTRRASTPTGVALQRVYETAHPLGEGVSTDGVSGVPGGGPPVGQGSTMLGRYQPYGFVLPPGAGPHGLQLLLHGLAENHSSRLYLPGADQSIVEQLGIRHDRILATPLARGWRGWYSAHSARDVFDVLGDVIANYANDPDRLYIGGLSMGGYGVLRLGGLFPDLWAGAMNWIGHTGDFFNGTPLAGGGGSAGAHGNAIDWVRNLRRIPITNWYSSTDELVPIWQALLLRDRLAEGEVESIFWLHAPSDHVLPVFVDEWTKESNWSQAHSPRRVKRPPRVVYRTEGRLFEPQLGMVPDHAYWVWSIVPAGDGYADVDVRSDGCGEADPRTESRSFTDPSLSPLPVVIGQEQVVVGHSRAPTANRLVVTTSNVSSFAIDTGPEGACLTSDTVLYEVTTDRAMTLTLGDGRMLSLPEAGTWKGEIASVGSLESAAATSDARRSELPATGGRANGVPAVAVLLMLLLAGRRLSAAGRGRGARLARERRYERRGRR